MKKALAQNPNLLRTLMGLSVTLILLLSYAVYGATVSPSYYLYTTETEETIHVMSEPTRMYQESTNTTTWAWDVPANSSNLTWVHLSTTELSAESNVRLINAAGLYSHRLLGVESDQAFSCAEQCQKNTTHQVASKNGEDVAINALTSYDPARRNNGTVYGADIAEATSKARALVEYDHLPSTLRIEIIEVGNRETSPSVSLVTVNEEFDSIAVFSVDAGTEFLWALAAVIGCFSMVLIPSFTVYFAAKAKEKKDQVKLENAEQKVSESLE
ncbi:MAG: hypothetical protein L7U62_04335 [Candidatus Poseidoniaceae archaeon]|nr:hypothetical protein [Candidatus Poseidoniaceae archaeon]